MKIDRPVVFFDGVCNLCNQSIDFLMTHRHPSKEFFIGSLQGQTAKELLPLHYSEELASIVLLEADGEILKAAPAVLQISTWLKFPWNLLVLFKYLPAGILDWGYNFIANKRYQWWGKRDICRLPLEEERHFFLP